MMVSSPRYLDVGQGGPMKAAGVCGKSAYSAATFITYWCTSSRLGCCWVPSAVLGDAIFGVMAESDLGKLSGV